MKVLAAVLILIGVSAAVLWLFRKSHTQRTDRSGGRRPSSTQLEKAQSAAKRALCLASVVIRANSEYQLHPEPGDLPSNRTNLDRDFAATQEESMKQVGLCEAASAHERALLEKPIGTWEKQEIADGQWREEALAVLMWSLRLDTELPAYDKPAFTADVMKLVPRPSASQTFVANAKLRNPSEILKARDIAELWLWRARTTQLQRDHHEPPKGMTFESVIAMTARKAQEDGLFTAIDNDFPAFHASYARLSESQWQIMHSIAHERLYALNWLCGYADDWDDIRTDT